MIESDDYKKGWYDGYQAAKREQQVNIPTTPYIAPKIEMNSGCSVCGRTGISGVVCYLQNCPNKIVSYTHKNDIVPVNK